MNTCSAFLVRVVCLVLACAWIAPCAAQGADGGLTGDFDKLSPKERSKIAAKETQEAAADSGYQKIMQQADAAFRAGRYEDALSAFQEARGLRPYNVYPKVKIQDLQALIKRRDQELSDQKSEPPPPAEPVPTEAASPQPTASPEPPETMASPPSYLPEPPTAAAATPAASLSSPEEAEVTTPETLPVEQDTAPPLPVGKSPLPAPGTAPLNISPASTGGQARPVPTPGPDVRPTAIGERVYLEAGATVTERTVEDEGRPVVYKKVAHPWGQTFHFKDGLSISEREWKDRFSE